MNVIERIEVYMPKGACALAIDKSDMLELLRLAKLGEAAEKAIQKDSFFDCGGNKESDCDCIDRRTINGRTIETTCPWQDFCRLRSGGTA